MDKPLKVFSTSLMRPMVERICRTHLSMTPGNVHLGRFRDGEIQCQYLEDIRDKDVYIVGSTQMPHENLFEMLLMVDAARRASAGRITVVVTYLAYNRQDRKDKPRVPVTAQMVAEFFRVAGAQGVLLFDIHSAPTASFFRGMSVDHLYYSPVMIPYLRKITTPDMVFASPDKGGVERSRAYSDFLGGTDLVVFDKGKQDGKIDPAKIIMIGEVKDRDVMFVDDMVDSGTTVTLDSMKAHLEGAKSCRVAAPFAVLSEGAVEKLRESPICEFVTTDAIVPPGRKIVSNDQLKITVLTIAPFVAEAIRRYHAGESLSKMFLKK